MANLNLTNLVIEETRKDLCAAVNNLQALRDFLNSNEMKEKDTIFGLTDEAMNRVKAAYEWLHAIQQDK